MAPFPKYVLLQLPGWIVAALVLVWFWSSGTLSTPVALAAGGFWVVKDFALYPLLRSAYEPPGPVGSRALVGESAVVRRRLDPAGLVRVRGETWQAEILEGPAAEEGETVRIEGADGLRLFVRRP